MELLQEGTVSAVLDVEMLWKGTASAKFWTIRLKLCGNCAFMQNLHTSKQGEIWYFTQHTQ